MNDEGRLLSAPATISYRVAVTVARSRDVLISSRAGEPASDAVRSRRALSDVA
jgi:hypothetical protein